MLRLASEFPPSHLYLLSPKANSQTDIKQLNEVYKFWHQIWNDTFVELKGQELKYSDDFVRQDEIAVLYAEGKIVGTFSFSWFNLELSSHRNHSYFKSYPKDVLEKLEKQNLNQIMTMGYLAVHEDWRKTNLGPFVSEVLVGVACKRLVSSPASILLTFTRNNRKMNELGYRHGAKCLKASQREHNVEVDFIGVHRNEVQATPVAGIPELIESVWNTRIDHSHQHIEKEKQAA